MSMTLKSLGSRNLAPAHPGGLWADCTVTSDNQESLAKSRVHGSLCLLLSKPGTALGPACEEPVPVWTIHPGSLACLFQAGCMADAQSIPVTACLCCEMPLSWPSVVEGVSWCSRNGRIVTLQGEKEAQKVTWSFPCSHAGPTATNPCSKQASAFLKAPSVVGPMRYSGTRHPHQITSSFIFPLKTSSSACW